MCSSGTVDGTCGDSVAMALQMAQELTHRGEIYLALSVLAESMNAHSQLPQECGSRPEWSILVNLLNMTQVHYAAEKAFEITSFLDRAGLEPIDDGIEDEHTDCSQYRDKDHAPTTTLAENPAIPSTIAVLPSLASEESIDSSSTSGGESTCTLTPGPLSQSRWNRFRQKRRRWRTSFKMFIKSIFRQRKSPASEQPSNQEELQISPVGGEMHSHTSNQDHLEDAYDSNYRAKATVSEQSTSRSRYGGLWALSECDILAVSETSDAIAASCAILEDQPSSPSFHERLVESDRERGMIRFFNSFRFRSDHHTPG